MRASLGERVQEDKERREEEAQVRRMGEGSLGGPPGSRAQADTEGREELLLVSGRMWQHVSVYLRQTPQ